jgi:hypothetical protein
VEGNILCVEMLGFMNVNPTYKSGDRTDSFLAIAFRTHFLIAQGAIAD